MLFDWDQLKHTDKQHLKKQRPILILGPRDISLQRINQVKQQLQQNLGAKQLVLWGCLKEKYIPGLTSSPQFKTLSCKKLQAAQINNILSYNFNYSSYLLKELKPQAVLAFYGSWHRAFHYTPLYHQIIKNKLKIKFLGCFADDNQAQAYARKLIATFKPLISASTKKFTDQQLLALAKEAAKRSFDYTYQTGAVLAKNGRPLLTAHNTVLPFESYTLQHGASKEKHLSPTQDLNHFDTNHAEVELILQAQQQRLDLSKTSLYINLLPCPICARMIARSNIQTVIYEHDHSQGYAFNLLKSVGKKVVRVRPQKNNNQPRKLKK